MSENSVRIGENLLLVRQRITAAAARAGRRADEIKLVGVTKTAGTAEIRALVQAGCADLGESRPQLLWQKAAELADLPIRWHLIGHLQRNKVRRTLPLTRMIHSADGLRIIQTIDAAAGELFRGNGPDFSVNKHGNVPFPQWRVPLLLEVNISGDAAKGGFKPHELEPLLSEIATLQYVEIKGLMCMASLEGGGETARRDFAGLRELRGRLRANCPAEIVLDELSMGMSGDYETAVEEGATIVRVGTALFEGVIQ